MILTNVIEASQPLNIGLLISNIGAKGIASSIAGISSGSVVFGKENPIWNNYQKIKEMVIKPMENVVLKVADSINRFSNVDIPLYVAVGQTEDLQRKFSRPMQEAVLTYAPVRQLLIDNRISAYGIENVDLPPVDPWERIISNGLATTQKPYMTWIHKNGDPDYKAGDISKVEDTRWFISEFLSDQLGPDGDELDPTEPNMSML